MLEYALLKNECQKTSCQTWPRVWDEEGRSLRKSSNIGLTNPGFSPTKKGAMQTVYRLNANELDENFLAGLKATFKDQEIEIIVYGVDETAYLMVSEPNRARLLQAVENIKQRSHLVEINLDELE